MTLVLGRFDVTRGQFSTTLVLTTVSEVNSHACGCGIVGFDGISGGMVGGTPAGSLGGGTLLGAGEGTPTGSGPGVSVGRGGRPGAGLGSAGVGPG